MKRRIKQWVWAAGISSMLACLAFMTRDVLAACNVPPGVVHSLVVTKGSVSGPLFGWFCIDAYTGTTFGEGTYESDCSGTGPVAPSLASIPTVGVGTYRGSVKWSKSFECEEDEKTENYDITLYKLVEDTFAGPLIPMDTGLYSEISIWTYKSNPVGGAAGNFIYVFPAAIRTNGTYSVTGGATSGGCELSRMKGLRVGTVEEHSPEKPLSDTTTSDPAVEGKCSEGEPIDTANGNVYFPETDIVVPCPGIPLVFARRYNSVLSERTSLGFGWTHSYNWSLKPAEFIGPQSMAKQGHVLPPSSRAADDQAGLNSDSCNFGAISAGRMSKLLNGDHVNCEPDSSVVLGQGKSLIVGNNATNSLSVLQSTQNGQKELAILAPAGTTLINKDGSREVLAQTTPVPVSPGESCTLPAGAKVTMAGQFASTQFPQGASMRFERSEYCGKWFSLDDDGGGGGGALPATPPDPVITNGFVTVMNGEGRKFKFSQDGAGQYFSASTVPMTLEMTNNAYQLTLPGRVVYTFSDDGVLMCISDGWGNVVRLSYSITVVPGQYTSNMLVRVAHDNGQALDFSYESNRLVRVENASNLVVRFVYNSDGELVNSVRTASSELPGEQWSAAYAYQTFMTQRVNAAGTVFAYQYATNSAGQPTPVGISTVVGTNYFADQFVYDETKTIVTRARGDTNQVVTYQFDPDTAELIQIVGPCVSNGAPGPWTTSFYDGAGNVTNTVTGDGTESNTFTTVQYYDARHNVTNEGVGYCSAPTTWWRYGWDIQDLQLTSVTAPDGAMTRFEYTNGSMAVIRQMVSSNLSYDTRFYYLTNGLLSSITNANGHGMAFSYDTNGFPASINPPVGPTIGMTYNHFGNLIGVNLEGGRTIGMERNALGWLTQLTYPDGSQEAFSHDGRGAVTNQVDAAGRVTRMTWLPMGRLASVTRILEGATNQEATLRLDYDLQMNSLRIRDELNRPVESYVLDIQDRPVVVTNVEGQVMTVTYGVGGIVKALTRFDGTVVGNRYDSQGWVAAVMVAGTTNTFGYTSGGLLETVSNEAGMISNTFDSVQRLIRSTGVGPNAAMDIGYYPAGQVSNVTTVAGSVTYRNDEAERLVSQESPAGAFTYSYNPSNGLVESIQYPNGMQARYAFDVMDRVTGIEWVGNNSNLIRSLGYGYDAAGMITNVTRETGEYTAYAYDSLYRLTGERTLDSSSNQVHGATWNYDLVGNRLGKTEDGIATAYTLGQGNRLAIFGAEGAAYQDAAGCVTALVFDASSRLDLAWNSQYQMTAASTNGVVAEQYVYDVAGRRVMTVSGGVTNWHVYAGPHVVADLDASGAMVRSYVWGPGIDNLLAIQTYTNSGGSTFVSSVFCAIKDHLGSVLAMTDSSGNIVESYRYDAWGRTTVYNSNNQQLSNSAIGNRYCWQGREYSWVTGLYNFRARWYDPITGRWLSNDPIGISGGLNQNCFVGNNPVNFRDPSGCRFVWGKGVSDARAKQILKMYADVQSTEAGLALFNFIQNSDVKVYVYDYDNGGQAGKDGQGRIKLAIDPSQKPGALAHEMQHVAEDICTKKDPANIGVESKLDPVHSGSSPPAENRAIRAQNIVKNQYYKIPGNSLIPGNDPPRTDYKKLWIVPEPYGTLYTP